MYTYIQFPYLRLCYQLQKIFRLKVAEDPHRINPTDLYKSTTSAHSIPRTLNRHSPNSPCRAKGLLANLTETDRILSARIKREGVGTRRIRRVRPSVGPNEPRWTMPSVKIVIYAFGRRIDPVSKWVGLADTDFSRFTDTNIVATCCLIAGTVAPYEGDQSIFGSYLQQWKHFHEGSL